MLGGMFLFAAADMHAKFLTASFHPVQIIWFRQFGLTAGVAILIGLHGSSILATGRRRLQAARGALVAVSSLLFVYAVRHVPLADAVAASFVAPFFLTLLGAWLLGERVGIGRWVAVVVGLVGATIIVRPGMGVVHPAILLVLVAAALYAVRQAVGRLLADTDGTLTTIAWTALVASALISLPMPFVWQSPTSPAQWLTLLSMAALAGTGEVLVIKSLEVAEAAVVAPIHYTLIVWGTLYGYLVFGQWPDAWTGIGTAIIVAAGLYTLKRGGRRQA